MNRRDFLTGLGAIPLLAVTSAINVDVKHSAPVERRETAHRKPINADLLMPAKSHCMSLWPMKIDGGSSIHFPEIKA